MKEQQISFRIDKILYSYLDEFKRQESYTHTSQAIRDIIYSFLSDYFEKDIACPYKKHIPKGVAS